jgi:ABC-2 type transport system permease protein
MLLSIARKELVSALRDGRVLWSAAIFALMLIAALASAAQRYVVISKERAAAQAIVNEQWANQGEKNPHAAAHYGVYAFKPVTPLSFFDTGVASFTGVSIWLEAHKQNMAEGEPARDATAIARFGELTGAFTLQMLLPLLVILLAFASFAGEREQGTLRQVLAMGVSPLRLYFGKALGAAATAGLFVVPVFVLGLLGLALAPGGAAFLGHAAVMALVYLVYAAIFLFLTLAVSAAADSARTALVVMVAFWAVSSVALPKAAADVARLIHETPTFVAFQKAIAADLENGIDGKSLDALVAERKEATLRLYKVDTIEKLPINFQGIVLGLQEQVSNAVFDKNYGALYTTLNKQKGVFETASVLSPRLAVQLASMELAETSLGSHIEFARQAESYRRNLIDTMNKAMTINSTGANPDYRAGPELWAQAGVFAYTHPPLGKLLAGLGPSFMVMFLWLAASVAAGVLAARKLKALVA